MAEGKILETIIEVLKALGYDTSNATITYSWTYTAAEGTFAGSISFWTDGMEVVISVYMRGLGKNSGKSYFPRFSDAGPNKFIHVVLKLNSNIGASELYHVVGHEMVHVKQYTSGKFFQWVSQWGIELAIFIAEQEAVEWNLSHLEYTNYENARREWEEYMVQVIEKVLGVWSL